MGLAGLGLLSLTLTPNVLAQSAKPEAQAPETQIPWTLEGVTVTHARKGPAMWRVEKDGQEVWILGAPTWLSNNDWDARGVEKALEGVSVVYTSPVAQVSLFSSEAVGLAANILVLHHYNLKDGKTLEDLGGPDLWARVAAQAPHSGMTAKTLRSYRPMWAIYALLDGAETSQHLVRADEKVAAIAKRRHIKVRPVAAYAAGKVFSATSRTPDREALPCLAKTLDALEAQRKTIADATRAFATADLRTLERTRVGAFGFVCLASVAHQGDFGDRSVADTTDDITSALARHEKAFFILGLNPLLSQDGVLARLRAHGYRVDTPGD